MRDNTVKVTVSSKTKFEHEKNAVDKSHVKVGDRAGVVGNKLPTWRVDGQRSNSRFAGSGPVLEMWPEEIGGEDQNYLEDRPSRSDIRFKSRSRASAAAFLPCRVNTKHRSELFDG